MSREVDIRKRLITKDSPDFFYKVREIKGADGNTYYEVVSSRNVRLGTFRNKDFAVLFSVSGRLWEYMNLITTGQIQLMGEFNVQFDNRLKNQEA